MPTGDTRLRRIFRVRPERVYRAFLDVGATAKWLPSKGFTDPITLWTPPRARTA